MNDPVFSALGIAAEDLTEWKHMGAGFAPLVRIVIGQQVSTAAAASLWNRFTGAVRVIDPETVLRLNEDEMRELGLSRQKISYIHGLSRAVQDGAFNPDDLHLLSDDDVMATITSLKGFGKWSGEIYQMFALARPDIWPAGDLGVQEGLRLYVGRNDRPDADEAMALGDAFRPHRTAAALLLWYMKGQSKKK
jgi:DNA-3-methyladenine glycosylase II